MNGQPRIAIVGAGAAGAYTVGELLNTTIDARIDVFERLPTPWGLLRSGVAPDHQDIKQLDVLFGRNLERAGCRFFGNVEIGRDLRHADLAERYCAVIYAVGARADRRLGIPGEELPGSLSAGALVGWYNGHPDYRDLRPDLSGRRAVIIGNGNVAADVARILTLPVAELERTDIADHALAALRESALEEVVICARRGPAQTALTNAVLDELGQLPGVTLRVDPGDAELDEVSERWLAHEGTFTARRNVELVRRFAARSGSEAERGKRISLRFFRAPVAIVGGDRVRGVELARTELELGGDGRLHARTTDDTERIDCDLVLRSVGYRGVPVEGVPFDEGTQVLPNDAGRVLDVATGRPVPGLYAVGWIKRGPTGILGTNKRDAQQTVAALVEDFRQGRLPAARPCASDEIAGLLAGGGTTVVDLDGWRALDRHERGRGHAQARPRVKVCSSGELLALAGNR